MGVEIDDSMSFPSNVSPEFGISLDGLEPANSPVEVGRFGSLSHYLQGFIHSRLLFGISSINSISLEHVFFVSESKTEKAPQTNLRDAVHTKMGQSFSSSFSNQNGGEVDTIIDGKKKGQESSQQETPATFCQYITYISYMLAM